ncbi:hypothetical protein QB910_000127 [Dabrowskivirus KKP3916]|uniref:CopG family transcriptional regulator n=1 Tax=Alicyclobacillus phage KKP_3916 TaxID=3040651 RepID=A0AAT9V7T3_9CAUD|nr:hypothetical protein QB910_000127 [Alicyclobacillus phage KKP 3916]
MPERYSFRITRKTKWIEDIVENIPKQDRSEFIRECFLVGLKTTPEYKQYQKSLKTGRSEHELSSVLSSGREDRKFVDVQEKNDDELEEKLDMLGDLYR